jgi:hypothetical protein
MVDFRDIFQDYSRLSEHFLESRTAIRKPIKLREMDYWKDFHN